jgi:hypothetical protein
MINSTGLLVQFIFWGGGISLNKGIEVVNDTIDSEGIIIAKNDLLEELKNFISIHPDNYINYQALLSIGVNAQYIQEFKGNDYNKDFKIVYMFYKHPSLFSSFFSGIGEVIKTDLFKFKDNNGLGEIIKHVIKLKDNNNKDNKKPNMRLIQQELDVILKQKIDTVGFGKYIESLIAKKDFKIVDVIKGSGMEQSYLYKIIKGTKTPSRDQAIKLAIALNLNIIETNDLLARLGYILYGENKRDSIISFCIARGASLYDIDSILDKYHEKTLLKAS